MPNIGSRRRFISAVFKIHLIAIYWFVDQSSERRAKSITNSGFWTSLIMTLIASRLLRRFQKSPGCHACWAHGISQRACLQRGGEDKGDTGPVIDTCKNWNWYTMIYMWIMLSSPCILCKKWWSKKQISCRIRAGQSRFRLFVVAAHCQYASLGTMSSQIRWRQGVNG